MHRNHAGERIDGYVHRGYIGLKGDPIWLGSLITISAGSSESSLKQIDAIKERSESLSSQAEVIRMAVRLDVRRDHET